MRVRRIYRSCLLLAILVLLRCSVTEYKYLADGLNQKGHVWESFKTQDHLSTQEIRNFTSGLQATWWFQGDGISYKENFLDFALYSSNHTAGWIITQSLIIFYTGIYQSGIG